MQYRKSSLHIYIDLEVSYLSLSLKLSYSRNLLMSVLDLTTCQTKCSHHKQNYLSDIKEILSFVKAALSSSSFRFFVRVLSPLSKYYLNKHWIVRGIVRIRTKGGRLTVTLK